MTQVVNVKAGAKVEAQQKPGAEAVGYAFAQSVIATAIGHANVWNRFVGRLIEMPTAAREAARKELRKHVSQMGAHVKVNEDNPAYKGAKASAVVRLSQITKISQALDAGLAVEVKRNPDNGVPLRDAGGVLQPVNPFHFIVGEARALLGSDAKGRGRPAKPFIEKLAKLIEDTDPSADDLAKAAEVLAQMLAAKQ
jgi:hypothetical protein